MLRSMLLSGGEAQGGRRLSTHVIKYVRFALSEHEVGAPKLPLLRHFTTQNLMLFVLWAARSGINGGWDSLSSYITAIVKYMAGFNAPDPRTVTDEAAFVWASFRKQCKLSITTVRKLKLKLQPAHVEAMLRDMRKDSWVDRQDNALYLWLLFAGIRVGHCVPKSPKDPKHMFRFENYYFLPTFGNPHTLFVYVPSTKTRGVNAGKPWWQAVGRAKPTPRASLGSAIRCPVLAMREWFRESYTGNPKDAVFKSATAPQKTLGRTEFTTRLRARLRAAAPRLGQTADDFSAKAFSGISFRKGCASMLSGHLPTNRLMDQFDHADVRSTREYTQDSIAGRSTNSAVIASALGWNQGGSYSAG
jgi:hypothetical protein